MTTKNTPFARSTRMLLAAAIACTAGLAQAQVTPTGTSAGVVVDTPGAGVTNITAPNNAIIEYSSFNVGSGDTVNFIQPGATSRVLNRINSNTPSQIDGTINANGIVYFVNPAGVTFGPNSVVDVAGIFAAAGSMSDTDFLNQTDYFNNVTGDVTTHGVIRADTIAAFIGQSVTNTGTIAVPNGTVVLSAGDDVYIGNALGGLMVQVDAGPISEGGGVNQNGTINANSVALVTGDLASLAMDDGFREARVSPPAISPFDADLDGDCDVDATDLSMLLGNIGMVAPTKADGDFDGDGDVDGVDLGNLLLHLGFVCPPGVADASAVDDILPIDGLPVIVQEILIGEAGLDVLLNQMGIAPRPLLASERLNKAQARALFNDLESRAAGTPLADGSLPVANVRLNADVVRRALQVFQERIAAEGVPADKRMAQIRIGVDAAQKQMAANGKAFDANELAKLLQRASPALFDNIAAINDLRGLMKLMGLSDAELANGERKLIEGSRPESLTAEQMEALLDAAGSLSPIAAG